MQPPDTDSSTPDEIPDVGQPWYRLLNRYHWFVLVVASLGWLFDTMDQQLFNIARRPAMQELLVSASGAKPTPEMVAQYSGWATAIFLIGWGVGGIGFGILGDLIGRAKSMLLTILIYSLFTGLSALSVGFWDFAFYRFLTGLGVGGEFAVGVSLVAEVMPDRARPFALGMLQALSAVGNITAALVALAFADEESGWRYMFIVGTVPALLAIFIRRKLKEPERWQAASAAQSFKERVGAYRTELFGNPLWARRAVIGLLLASSGIIGLWGIVFFAIDLQRAIFQAAYEAQGLSKEEVAKYTTIGAAIMSIMLNVGAFLGMYTFTRVTARFGRRPTFAVTFVLAMLSTAFVFWKFETISDTFWMVPIMGFFQLGLFGGYAIYFPELFPTRLRSTGTSFCYNGARFVGALGPTAFGLLTSIVYADHDPVTALRYAGITMCSVYLIGLCVLPFAPETKGQPLPE